MRRLTGWAQEAGLLVVEDVAQAHGAVFEGRQVGTWGDAAAYSFYPTKNLGALGDAGAVVSMSARVLDVARSMRNYGQTSLYRHEYLGLNSRLDEIQAAVLSARLLQLREETAKRQAIAAQYFEAISNDHVLLMERPADAASYVAHIFAVRTSDRERFILHMSDRGIDCLVHYPLTLPEQVAAGAWDVNAAETPVAMTHAATCVSLPCRPGLSQWDIDRIIDATNGYRP
jgi:dTDP-4-amino-4,6-dideoxygalactose transaminase